MEQIAQWANDIFLWVGFGVIAGLLAKALMPGKDPGDAFATIVVGVVGTIIGAATIFFFTGIRVKPISVAGFAAAIAGSGVLLGCYRLLSGKYRGEPTRRRATTRRRVSVVEEPQVP
ncbi:MAG: hypothetical protein K2X38_21710 [Gemmataceae bacterium]|nr:hypothetical protein [Gemmataceae bacterium]